MSRMIQPPRAPSSTLARDFSSFNRDLASGGSRDDALQRLVDEAVAAIPGCDWAAVTEWPHRASPRTLAYAGDVARQVDELQYSTRQGPCLTAAQENEGGSTSPLPPEDSPPVEATDLTAEARWPQFVQATLAQTPVRAIVSHPLLERPVRSALNLYSAQPGGFDASSIRRAAIFVDHARALMLHMNTSDRAANLDVALASNRQIGIAMGILMGAQKITADEAFALLRRSSQHLNRKLRDVAEDVIHTGELPGVPPADGRGLGP